MVKILIRYVFSLALVLGIAPTRAVAAPSVAPWASVEWSGSTMTITLWLEGNNFPADFNGGQVSYRSSGVDYVLANAWTDNGNGSYNWEQVVPETIDRLWIDQPSLAVDWYSQSSFWRPIAGENGVERTAVILSEWDEGTSTFTLLLLSHGYTFASNFSGPNMFYSDGTTFYLPASDWTPLDQGADPSWIWSAVLPENADPWANHLWISTTVPLEYYGSGSWDAKNNGLVRHIYDPCVLGSLAPGARCWLLPNQVAIGDLNTRDPDYQWIQLFDTDATTGMTFESPNGPALLEAPFGAEVASQPTFPLIVRTLEAGCTNGCAQVHQWIAPDTDNPARIWTEEDIHIVFLPLAIR